MSTCYDIAFFREDGHSTSPTHETCRLEHELLQPELSEQGVEGLVARMERGNCQNLQTGICNNFGLEFPGESNQVPWQLKNP